MSLTPISQKVHDFSFAVFRVAALVRNKELRKELEHSAIDLVSKYEEVFNRQSEFYIPNVVDKLERIVMLSESIGEIKPINAGVLKRELNNLQTAITFHLNGSTGNEEDVDIRGMFSPSEILMKESQLSSNTINQASNSNTSNNPNISNISNNSDKSIVSNEPNGISIRQTAIMRSIRETQFCRLRNILEAMPNVSERTIRNDIQDLIERGMARRIGGGGPSSYFETMEVEIRQSNLPISK